MWRVLSAKVYLLGLRGSKVVFVAWFLLSHNFFFFQILDLTIANASIQTQINQTFPFQMLQMLQMLLFEMSLFQMSKLCKCSKQTGEAQTLLGTEASFLYVQSLVEVTKLQMKTILD